MITLGFKFFDCVTLFFRRSLVCRKKKQIITKIVSLVNSGKLPIVSSPFINDGEVHDNMCMFLNNLLNKRMLSRSHWSLE